MITVIVPRRKRVPRLKKQDGTWIVIVHAMSLYHDSYRLWAEQLQEHADTLNRRERALRNIMRNMPLKQLEKKS